MVKSLRFDIETVVSKMTRKCFFALGYCGRFSNAQSNWQVGVPCSYKDDNTWWYLLYKLFVGELLPTSSLCKLVYNLDICSLSSVLPDLGW